MKEAIDKLLAENPSQKAKDLARQIGMARKEVNSFLHSHLDRYEKDDEFRWSPANGGELGVTLPGGGVPG